MTLSDNPSNAHDARYATGSRTLDWLCFAAGLAVLLACAPHWLVYYQVTATRIAVYEASDGWAKPPLRLTTPAALDGVRNGIREQERRIEEFLETPAGQGFVARHAPLEWVVEHSHNSLAFNQVHEIRVGNGER